MFRLLGSVHSCIRPNRVARPSFRLGAASGISLFLFLSFLLSSVLAPTPAFALEKDRDLTQYTHRIWQTQQGLPAGSTYTVFQSADSYLWIGARVGLARFDGVRFTPLNEIYPDAPGALWVRAAIEDSKGRLWIGTNNDGVYRVDVTGTKHYGTEEGFPTDLSQCLAEGPEGQIWACTETGVARIDPETGKIDSWDTDDGLGGATSRAICFDSEGTVWVGGDTPSINFFNGEEFEFFVLQGLPAATSVRALECSTETVWVGTTFGLVALNEGQQTLYTADDGMVDNFVFSLAHGEGGTLWIGTRSGFSRFRDGQFDSFYPRDGLSQGTALSVYEDHEGSLWVGTKRGLNQFVNGGPVPYTTTEGLPSNEAGPVLEDSSGIMWTGTLDAGLARFDGKQFTSLTTANGLPSNGIYALAEADGSLWVGTRDGLTRVTRGRVQRTYREADGLPSRDIRMLFRDRDGILWAGTADGLASFRGNRFVTDRRVESVAIRAIGQDRDGRLLVAMDDGLMIEPEPGSRQPFEPLTAQGVYLRNANVFHLDPDGLLWVGLNGAGLRLIENDRIYAFNENDGLYDGEIYGIASDDQGRLWMTCSRGIFAVNREELRRFAVGELDRFTNQPYTPIEALRVIESRAGVHPAMWQIDDGRMWLSTIRGFIVFDPAARQQTVPPPAVIENPIVDGQSQLPSEISHLPAGPKNLQFNFSGLSYLAPERLVFRYKMEGYDEDWITSGRRREAFYTNLPPGEYTFSVMACSAFRFCSEPAASMSFTLAPAIYQRAWFWPLMLLLGAIIAWGGYQLHIRQLRQRYDLILSERSRIARELHDTLIQGFSGITMALQGFSTQLTRDSDKETLNEIISDAATCLRETRQSVAGLRAVKGTDSGLAASIREAAREITETKGIHLKLDIDPNIATLPANVEYNLMRIASEAIGNAVKHATADTIGVTLRTGPDGLHLEVTDDGVGLPNGSVAPGHGHYGVIGMKERATQIGAEFNLTNRPKGGTAVSVFLPAERSVEVVR